MTDVSITMSIEARDQVIDSISTIGAMIESRSGERFRCTRRSHHDAPASSPAAAQAPRIGDLIVHSLSAEEIVQTGIAELKA
jgi:hypothetical protein